MLDLAPFLMRFLEHLTAVLIGGMTIYLGFRLFLAVPEHRDAAGKLVLPWDVSIVLTRVGRGVFFALFGVVAVSLALLRPLDIRFQDSPDPHRLRYAGQAAGVDEAARADARALLRGEMATLNTLPRQLRADLAEHERDSMSRGLARVKLALLKDVWGGPEEGFGDFAEFERWVRQGGDPHPPPRGMEGALELYRYGVEARSP